MIGGSTASATNPYPALIGTSIRDTTSAGVYSTFLNACCLGSATYIINDLVVRLETIQYDDSAYEYAKQISEVPRPYLSLRQ